MEPIRTVMTCCAFALGLAGLVRGEDETPYLTVNDPGNCKLLVNGVETAFGTIPYSATTTIEARPNSGYECLGWNGGVPFGAETNNPLVVKAGKVRSLTPWIRTYTAPTKRTPYGGNATWQTGYIWPSSTYPGPNDDIVIGKDSLLRADRFIVCKSLTIKDGGRLVIGTENNTDISYLQNSALKGYPSAAWESASLFVKGDLKIESGGQLAVGAQSWTVYQDYTYAPYGSDVHVGGNLTMTGTGSKMLVCGGPITNGLTAVTGCGFLTVAGTISIGTNTTLYLTSEGYTGGSVLVRAKAIDLANGGTICADARGFSGKKIAGEQYVATLAPGLGYGSNKGGGYGGKGYMGWWATCPARFGVTYGNPLVPLLPGSAGGCNGSQCWHFVAAGGGLVRLRATSINLGGTITADGEGTWADKGKCYYASSGGGIWVTTSSKDLVVAPTAKLSVKGGVANFNGAHGGGGRIALVSRIDDATLNYLETNGAYPADMKVHVRDKAWFEKKNPGVTINVSPGGGGEENYGTFTYVNNKREGFALLVR